MQRERERASKRLDSQRTLSSTRTFARVANVWPGWPARKAWRSPGKRARARALGAESSGAAQAVHVRTQVPAAPAGTHVHSAAAAGRKGKYLPLLARAGTRTSTGARGAPYLPGRLRSLSRPRYMYRYIGLYSVHRREPASPQRACPPSGLISPSRATASTEVLHQQFAKGSSRAGRWELVARASQSCRCERARKQCMYSVKGGRTDRSQQWLSTTLSVCPVHSLCTPARCSVGRTGLDFSRDETHRSGWLPFAARPGVHCGELCVRRTCLASCLRGRGKEPQAVRR